MPGHGAICGQDGISLLGDVRDDIGEQAERLHQAGAPVEEAQQRYVVPERFKSLTVFAWTFTIGAAIADFYAGFEKG